MPTNFDKPKTVMKKSLTIVVAGVLILAVAGIAILLRFFIPGKSNFKKDILRHGQYQ